MFSPMTNGIFLLFLTTVHGLWSSSIFNRKVCYPHIGCFSSKYPFNNAKGILPSSPDAIGITFLLYTRKNLNQEQILKPYQSQTITSSNFVGSRRTIFITHGFTDTVKSGWALQMKDALLNKDDLNVITVDWSRGTRGIRYDKSTANTRVVGATVGKMVEALMKNAGVSLGNVHLIGHSLGAQIMGYAGKELRHLGQVGRITGLDPAGLNFERYSNEVKLDPSDAAFVDVIHTDGASLLEMAFGIRIPNGHADFYPNGGRNQPGCKRNWWDNIRNMFTGKISVIASSVGCSHSRAIHFFIESINTPCKFTAFHCKSYLSFYTGACDKSCKNGCNRMGYHASKTSTGTFFLKTNAAAPYYKSY